jgi:hypothetical protein
MIRPLFLIALLALAACGKPPEQQPTAPVAPATEATLPADAPKAVPAWTVSADGVGPITGKTPFDRQAIAALFPESEVKSAFVNLEGDEYPIITITGPNELSIEVMGDTAEGRIESIHAEGGPVIGPRGEILMTPFSALGLKASDCVIGADRLTGSALCRRPGTTTPAYVIGAPGQLSGNVGDTPDSGELTSKGVLHSLLWQAPLN